MTAIPNASLTPLDAGLTEDALSRRTVLPLLEDKHTVNKQLWWENEPQSSTVLLSVATANNSSDCVRWPNLLEDADYGVKHRRSLMCEWDTLPTYRARGR